MRVEQFPLYVSPVGDGPDDCWLWLGYRDPAGYGRVSFGGRLQPAHRVALEIENGVPVDRGLVVMHSCDNPPCVRPSHLRTGTRSENSLDMVMKNRSLLGLESTHYCLDCGHSAWRHVKAAGCRECACAQTRHTLKLTGRVTPAIVKKNTLGICRICQTNPTTDGLVVCSDCSQRITDHHATLKRVTSPA